MTRCCWHLPTALAGAGRDIPTWRGQGDVGRSSRKAGSGAHLLASQLLCCRSLAEGLWMAGGHNWTSWTGGTAGYITPSSPLWGNRALLQPSGVFPACPSAGTGVQGSDVVASGTWWPRAGTGRAHDREHQETKHGWMLPELCPGLSKLCWFKCHSSKRPHSHCGCRQRSCPVTSTRKGVPGSGIIPEMGSMQGVHALTGLIRPVKAPPANRGQGETRWQKV